MDISPIKEDPKPAPCPFCGGTELEVILSEDSELWAYCTGCKAGVLVGEDTGTGPLDDESNLDRNGVSAEGRMLAVEVWNKRHWPAPSLWERECQHLVMMALEWERLRRGMPGYTPETLAEAEKLFWGAARSAQGLRVSMLRQHIEASRAASPDGKTQWDRVEDFRVEHGHLPGEGTCPKCKVQP